MILSHHATSLLAGWSCAGVTTFLILQHIFSGPRVQRWPTLPSPLRVIIMALLMALAYRSVNILSNPDEPQGVVPLDGAVVGLLWAFYTGGMALEQWRRKRTPDTLDALKRFEAIAADPLAPPAAEVLTRGLEATAQARGWWVNTRRPPRKGKNR